MAAKKETVSKSRKLYRSDTDRVIAGVSGGLGEYFDIDPTFIRILFIFVTLMGGSGLLIYLALWLIIPSRNTYSSKTEDAIRKNADEIRQKSEEFAEEVRGMSKSGTSRSTFGLILILMGAVFLLSNFGLFSFFDMSKLWPLILVFIGIYILSKDGTKN